MSTKSSIEWTESTWNPITGCSKISSGCKNCYAERMAKRLQAMGQANYTNGFEVTIHDQSLLLPLTWKQPQTIFVNSMSDIFHDRVPIEFIRKIFAVMNQASWHTFQILTKRPERLLEVNDELLWPRNVWMGVTVESQEYVERIKLLKNCGAVIKFLSLEPLLSALPNLDLRNIDWVITGGESGPGARAINPTWVVEIRDQCINSDVPFFFKQWGGVRKKRTGSLLEGIEWKQTPNNISQVAQ